VYCGFAYPKGERCYAHRRALPAVSVSSLEREAAHVAFACSFRSKYPFTCSTNAFTTANAQEVFNGRSIRKNA
jgi:hypothetical protein